MFLFILSFNILGFFIYCFPITTHISVTFGVAFIIWFGTVLNGFYRYKTYYLSNFFPGGAPVLMSPFLVIIELLSNVSKPVALGMRLAANLTAGHILLAIISDFTMKLTSINGIFSFLPVLIIVFMTILEVFVLAIQAYVFCLLSLIYLKDSIFLH